MQTRANLLPEAPPTLLNPARLNVGSGITSAEQIEQMREKLLLENTYHLHANHATCGLALIATAVSMQYLYQHQPAFIAEWLAQEALQKGIFDHQLASLPLTSGFQEKAVLMDDLSSSVSLVDSMEESYRSMTMNKNDLSWANTSEAPAFQDVHIHNALAEPLPLPASTMAALTETTQPASELPLAEAVDFALDAGNHPQLQGIAPANSQVEVYINNQLAGVSESNEGGVWAWRHDAGLANGTYQLDTIAIDPQGHAWSLTESLTFTVDVIAEQSELSLDALLSPASELDFSLLFPQEDETITEEITLQILPEADAIWTDLLPAGPTVTMMPSGNREIDRWNQDLDLLAGSQP
ncbi:hypothetical protein [Duffyella gerundensis]|uniref:hypothetical protein n=1 Tax=Duffyella TaxID=3026546 RepID=UPI003F6DEDDD